MASSALTRLARLEDSVLSNIYRKTMIITMITIKEYSESVPLWHLRFLPALAGSLLTPTVYLLITGFPFTSAVWRMAIFTSFIFTGYSPHSSFHHRCQFHSIEDVVGQCHYPSELGLSPYAGALAGLMVVFDTAILAQSR